MIKITAIGGFDEVGKNCTAITVDDTTIICDMGIHLDSYIKYTESEEEDITKVGANELMRMGAIPDVRLLDPIKHKVKAIIPTHAHLDHVGAIPFLANRFNCDILCTPFTKEVISAIVKDNKMHLKNKIKALSPNATYKISNDITMEFVSMTHSTPHSTLLAIHTKYGTVCYANDFKFDNNPIIGKGPDYDRLREIGNKGVVALINDSLYAHDARKTPSESVAREMLKDVLLGTDSSGKLVIVTTFSSHLARLKSIIDMGQQMGRKIIFLGRSLSKYTFAGEAAQLVKFSKEVEIVKFGSQVRNRLSRIREKERHKYLLVMTGHQGEPNSVLSRIVDGKVDFRLEKGDFVVFSCKTIPSPTNIQNRAVLESKLRDMGVRMFTDIHVSGHASKEDLRDLLHMLKPRHVIPAHGDDKVREPMKLLALEESYKPEQIHMMHDGQTIVV